MCIKTLIQKQIIPLIKECFLNATNSKSKKYQYPISKITLKFS